MPIKDILAYLEKQKEQKPNFDTHWENGSMVCEQKEQKPSINIDQLKSLMLQYLQEAANEKDDLDIEADTDKWARKILGYDFEQKPVDLSEMMVHKEPYIAPVPVPMVADEQKPKASGKLSRRDYLYQLLIDQLITYSDYEYLIGQKPAEWSDTDNIGWDEAFACVTRAEKAAKNEEELQNAVTAEKWLKEIKFKYCVHPVKQELSEEDEKILESLISLIETISEYYISLETRNGYVAWLKSLRPQPKQEWSDEDDRIRQKLIHFISSPNVEGFMLASDERMFVSWLKSLRPMPKVAVADGQLWKPSEEQMNWLNIAKNIVGDTGQVVLKSLYNDLKKL